jgi:fluoride exporter
MATKLAWLALAGALGTLARFAISGFAQGLTKSDFPVGTLTVNALGCFCFGFIWALAEERMLISGETRFIILTGFMGAFTTFSTFAFETTSLMRDAEWLLTAANFLGHMLLGVILILGGMFVGRQF